MKELTYYSYLNRLFLALFLFGFSGILNAQNKSFTLSGKITGHDAEEMRISYHDEKGAYVSKTIKLDDGAFTYKNDNINQMEAVTLSLIPKDRRNPSFRPYGGSSSIQAFISPGVNTKVTGEVRDFVLAYPSGDKANEDMARYQKIIFPMMNESVLLSERPRKEAVDPAEAEKTKKKVKQLGDDVFKSKLDFIRNNRASVVSAWLLQDMMIRSQVSHQEAIDFFTAMDAGKLKGNTYYEEISGRVKGINSTAPGMPAPEIISEYTYDGKQFKLSSLKGKYVVLDFWGTWCYPCITGMPRMKEYADKYGDKMMIVGVASESDNGEKWKAFIEKHPEYNWPQVLSRPDADYIVKYNVAGYPTKIIIDPEGKIVERFVGESDAIYTKLEEVLN